MFWGVGMRIGIRYLRDGEVQELVFERDDAGGREEKINRPEPVLCRETHGVEDFTDQRPVTS